MIYLVVFLVIYDDSGFKIFGSIYVGVCVLDLLGINIIKWIVIWLILVYFINSKVFLLVDLNDSWRYWERERIECKCIVIIEKIYI